MHEHERIHRFLPLIQSLYKTSREKLGFEPHAKIVIIKGDGNMQNPLGKTAHYSPGEYKIGLYTQGRHIKDILRSLSHELVHHHQNCRGDFSGGAATVDGYAQEDDHLREMEREAYEHGNMIFRDWEDNLKKKGGKPLFTSTTPYVRPMMTNVVGSRLLEGDKMKNKVNESRLREIIRGVMQEMFNDDLREDTGIEPEQIDEQDPIPEDPEALSEERMAQLFEDYPELINEDGELDEGLVGKLASMAGGALKKAAGSKLGQAAIGAAGEAALEKASELGGKAIEKGAETLGLGGEEEMTEGKMEDCPKGTVMDDKIGDCVPMVDPKEAAKEVQESFFPKGRSIREKARFELNEALMSRWSKLIK